MAGRRLSADERAAWKQLAGTVRPIRTHPAVASKKEPAPLPVPPPALVPRTKQPAPLPSLAPRRPVAVLDAAWEKQIRRGLLVPELSIDLHGHSLAAAHGRLNQALAMARAQGLRVLLVITGKPRAGGSGRGAIRAEIGHWLQASAHSDAIASVRAAHPRHGGEGALYVILRRRS